MEKNMENEMETMGLQGLGFPNIRGPFLGCPCNCKR